MKLNILVQPNAKKNEVTGLQGNSVKMKIKALPVDGAANAAVILFLSEILCIPKRKISIAHGESSRNKVVEVDTDFSLEQIVATLLQK